MIAAIKPIAVNQDMAEISSSILVPIRVLGSIGSEPAI